MQNNNNLLFIIKKAIEIFFIFIILNFSKIFYLNYIWGTFNSKLTLFQSFSSSSFLIFPFSSIFYFIFQFFIGYNIFLKIPTLTANLYFYFLNKNENFKYIGSFLLLIFSFLLFIDPLGKEIYWYSFGWLISAILIFIPNLFCKSFVSIWASHAIGTLIQIYSKTNFLTKDSYEKLLLISWIERFILIITLILSYHFFLFLQKKINDIIYLLKKNYIIKDKADFLNDK